MEGAGVEVVREGGAWVVVNKPPGLLSVPGKGPDKQDCVPARVRAMFPAADGPLIAHRLDMETSGLMVLGLTPEAQRSLSMQFEARTIGKRYVALVEGWVEFDEGEIRLPMRLDVDNRPRQVVDFDQGKEALTRWRAVERGMLSGRECTRIEFEPVTGRSHQLRVHAAHPEGLDAPILGDGLYGDREAAERMMLHAGWLAFDEPADGGRVECSCEAGF